MHKRGWVGSVGIGNGTMLVNKTRTVHSFINKQKESGGRFLSFVLVAPLSFRLVRPGAAQDPWSVVQSERVVK